MNPISTQGELLAPAGSLEAFMAAMEAGADAVYCGLRDFSARARAKNFTLRDLEQMLAYAHGRGRRVYVTINTLVKEAELPQLCETLAALEALGADAVILQDPAVWRLARRHFPGLRLHASTQLTVHNAAGIRQLEQMGFKRAVLARELTLGEIAAVRRTTTLELEAFVHGALCFSFSGQCYFSSWLGGKSGNRGRCAQPCRRHYRYRGKEGYYFSTSDLSAIDLLPELIEAGVGSFKIEGRMKSAEYVHRVVSAYRSALDARPNQRKEAVRAAKELLKLSFGRQPTRGFLGGPQPTDIAVPSMKGATGRFLGEVGTVRGSEITFKTRDRVHVGDRLRVQPRTDQAGTAFTVKSLRQGRGGGKAAAAGSVVSVPTPFQGRFQVGDAIFKVSADQAFTMSENACRRRLEAAAAAPAPVSIAAVLQEGSIEVRARAGGAELTRVYPVETFPAEKSPLSRQTLEEVFARSGREPFSLETFSVGPLPPVVIPPSRLKEIRRDLYRSLREAMEHNRQQRRREHLQAARESLLPATAPQTGARSLTVAISDLRDLHLLNDTDLDRVAIPLIPRSPELVERQRRRLQGREEKILWDLPFIIPESEWAAYHGAVQSLFDAGFRSFRLNNLGHFPLFAGLEGLQLVSGYRLFAVNSQALLAWRGLGIDEATLYIEDDRENLAQVLARDTGLEKALTVYAPVPLITSRIPVRGVRADQPVVSDRGERYRVDGRKELTVLTSETDFSLCGRLAELQQMGCTSFVAELGHIGPFSPQGKKVLEAFKTDREIPGTSIFNYEMGME